MSTGPDPAKPGDGGEFDEGAGPMPRSAAPLSAEDLITLNEEIAGMAKAGLPLDKGLSALAREMVSGRLQQVTAQLAVDLKAGLTLPEALERQGGRVPPYYAALLAAGIRSGRISEVLGTLTVYARSLNEFRATIVSSLLYPLIVLVMGSVLLVFVGGFILPAYVGILESFKMKLPFLSEVVLWVGRHPLQVVAAPIALVIGWVLLERLWLNQTPEGRRLRTRIVYSLPIAGTLLRSARLAAFTDLLGILIEQGIPLPEAMRLAAEASSDPLLTEGARRVEAEISQGVPLGQALQAQQLWPELVIWMVGFGEKQGTLPAALKQVAQMYRREAEARSTLLRTVLPPLLVIILAASLGALFIFGLMAPFIALLDGLSGGGMKK
jgi:type II secretory pathway component PulF